MRNGVNAVEVAVGTDGTVGAAGAVGAAEAEVEASMEAARRPLSLLGTPRRLRRGGQDVAKHVPVEDAERACGSVGRVVVAGDGRVGAIHGKRAAAVVRMSAR